MSDRHTHARTRRLLLLCATTAINPAESEEAERLLREGIRVTDLIEIGSRNKILQLVTPNLLRTDTDDLIPLHVKRLLTTLYSANRERNKVLFTEANRIIETFQGAGLTALPLKGLHLAQHVYDDPGSRTLNDLDLLIRRDDRKAVSDVMGGIGYIAGDDDPLTGAIIEASRKEVVKWSMYIGNLHKHVKRLGTPFVEVCRVDFSYDATARGEYAVTEHLLDGAVEGRCGALPCQILNPVDFFLHIGLHLYKEAVNERWLEAGSAQNLIKYCDLREYLRRSGSEFTPGEVAARAIEIGAVEALRYSVARLRTLFPDPHVTGFAEGLDAWAAAKGVEPLASEPTDADDPALREWMEPV